MEENDAIDKFYSYLRFLKGEIQNYSEGTPEYEELLSEIYYMEKIKRLIF